ncbi:DUF3037 domain-containing protein [Armatimonas sp.]|uniref:DUF3037 domain-containing protein n=1 Tax=Armatimonas sp. TaxID=1872638 RepID=UPI00375179EC
MPTRGYYSLIQFCPDTCRLEAANIGVVLLCPDAGFFDFKLASNNDRVRRFFGLEGVQLGRVSDARRALESRFRTEQERFKTVEDLVQFNRSLGGNLLVTDPRPVKVYEPAVELDNLFNTLVGNREAVTSTRTGLRQRLRQTLDARPALKGKLLYDQKVLVPITGSILRAPVAFQNGTLNLIAPLPIGRRTFAQARDLALDGDLLRKHRREMENPAELWIALGTPEEGQEEDQRQQRLSLELFSEYGLPVYSEDRLDLLAEAVEARLH